MIKLRTEQSIKIYGNFHLVVFSAGSKRQNV